MLKAANFTNPLHILHVHSHNLQGNIVVAPSEKSLLETFKACWFRYTDSDPRSYYIGKVVDLPQVYVDKIRRATWDETVMNFNLRVQYGLTDYFIYFKEFPPHLEPCSCFNPDGKDRFDLFDYANYDEDDRGCSRCNGAQFIFKDKDVHKLIVATYPRWEESIPVASTEEIKEPIFVAGAHFGHHQSGAGISPLASIEKFYAATFSKACLFAFTGTSLPIPNAINNFIEAKAKERSSTLANNKEKQEKAMEESYLNEVIKSFVAMGYTPDELEEMKQKLLIAYRARRDK